jgi:hypothetical protein
MANNRLKDIGLFQTIAVAKNMFRFIRLWRDLADRNEIIRRLKRNVILTIAIEVSSGSREANSVPRITHFKGLWTLSSSPLSIV